MLLSSVRSTEDSSKFILSFFCYNSCRFAGPYVYDLALISSIFGYARPCPPLLLPFAFLSSFFLFFFPPAVPVFSLVVPFAGSPATVAALTSILLMSISSPKVAVRPMVSPRLVAFRKLILLSFLSIGLTIGLSATATAASAIAEEALYLRTVNYFIKSM